jgi:hypothetical protein
MKKFWVVLIIIVVAILLLYFIPTLILNQKIKQTLISLKNSGFATTIAEIKPKPTDQGRKAAELLTNAYQGLKRETPKGGIDVAGQERDIADSISYEANPALFKKIVNENQKEIDLLLSAAQYPKADFNFKYEDGLAAQIPPPTGNLLNFCCLLRIYAKNLSAEGKTDEALQVLNRTVHLSFILSDNMLFFHLIKAIALTKTLDLIQTTASKGSIAVLESLVDEINKIDVQASLTRATEVEMIMWQYLFSSGKKLQDNTLMSGMLLTPRQRFQLFLTNLAPVKKYVQLKVLNSMKKEIELTKLPYYQTVKDLDVMEATLEQPGGFIDLEKLFIPNLKLFVIRPANLEAKRNITLLGLKTIIAKKQTGKLPKTLNDIVANFPADPFNGNEYVYKPLPDGCLIYSVGKDGTDDSGDGKKDIVWKVKI